MRTQPIPAPIIAAVIATTSLVATPIAHADLASTRELVTAVGDADGRLAIRFADQWFAVSQRSGEWVIDNGVAAVDALATANDSDIDTPQCQPNGTTKEDWIRDCDGIIATEIVQSRSYRISVAGVPYRVEARQTVVDKQRIGGPKRSELKDDLTFVVAVQDPLDGQDWNIRIRAKRTGHGARGLSDDQINDGVTDDSWNRRRFLDDDELAAVSYTPEVELDVAYKAVVGAGTSALAAPTNPAATAAFGDATVRDNDHSYPEAISGLTKFAHYAEGAASSVYQFKRLYQFFMKGKTGSAGFSQGQGVCGGGEDAINEVHDGNWTFRAPLAQCTHRWPFLWGLCGLEAHVGIGVAGSFTRGAERCFDGAPVSVGMEGRLEFRAEAGAGFGCNLFIASASAGLNASVATGVHFATKLELGRLSAVSEMYNAITFGAYFRVRFLFWKKSWEPAFVRAERFGASIRKEIPELAELADQRNQTCDEIRSGGNGGGFGTCDVAGAVCGVDNQCAKYTEVEPGQWRRDVVGTCRHETCDDYLNAVRKQTNTVYDRFTGDASPADKLDAMLGANLTASSAATDAAKFCLPAKVCKYLKPIAGLGHPYAFWGGVGQGGAGLQVGAGADLVFDLWNKQGGAFVYGELAGNPFSFAEGTIYQGLATAANKPTVIDAWSGVFLGGSVSLSLAKLLGITVAGFLSMDSDGNNGKPAVFGVLGGITVGLPTPLAVEPGGTAVSGGFWRPNDWLTERAMTNAASGYLACGTAVPIPDFGLVDKSSRFMTANASPTPGAPGIPYKYVQYGSLESLLWRLKEFPGCLAPIGLAIGADAMRRSGLSVNELCP